MNESVNVLVTYGFLISWKQNFCCKEAFAQGILENRSIKAAGGGIIKRIKKTFGKYENYARSIWQDGSLNLKKKRLIPNHKEKSINRWLLKTYLLALNVGSNRPEAEEANLN